MKEDVKLLIEELMGTCESLDVASAAVGVVLMDLTMDDWADFDGEIFNCESCGWWFESHENNEGLCQGCYEDELEEELEDNYDKEIDKMESNLKKEPDFTNHTGDGFGV